LTPRRRTHPPIGCAHPTPPPRVDAYVEELIVTRSQRRRGVARALMEAVEAWAREAGARIVTLDTHVTNATTRALYDALGYREVGVILLREL